MNEEDFLKIVTSHHVEKYYYDVMPSTVYIRSFNALVKANEKSIRQDARSYAEMDICDCRDALEKRGVPSKTVTSMFLHDPEFKKLVAEEFNKGISWTKSDLLQGWKDCRE